MKMSNYTYDLLKRICLYVLPALATLVIAIGQIWGLEKAPLIGATITAIDTFLGSCLGISSINYYNRTAKPKEERMD